RGGERPVKSIECDRERQHATCIAEVADLGYALGVPRSNFPGNVYRMEAVPVVAGEEVGLAEWHRGAIGEIPQPLAGILLQFAVTFGVVVLLFRQPIPLLHNRLRSE